MPRRTDGPRCPDCGRPVHRLPNGRLLTLMPAPTGIGWSFGPHRCLSRAARYGAAPVVEGGPRLGRGEWILPPPF